MKNWLLCGHSNPRNLGDKLTDLRLYFPELKDFDWIDIENLYSNPLGSYDGVIFGGGGMLYGESELRMEAAVKSFHGSVIVFGAGLNYPDDGKPPQWPEWLKDCAYVALRDYYGSPYDWCPCPSCLHPAFDYSFVPLFDSLQWAVTYGHQLTPSTLHLSANKDVSEFGAVLQHLRISKYTTTDSYHGAYWARLLGNSVEVVNPESSIKFRLRGDAGLNQSRELVRDCYAKLLTHL